MESYARNYKNLLPTSHMKSSVSLFPISWVARDSCASGTTWDADGSVPFVQTRLAVWSKSSTPPLGKHWAAIKAGLRLSLGPELVFGRLLLFMMR